MRYVVARKRVSVAGSFRYPGDEVPEAVSWKSLRSLVDAGIIVIEDDGESLSAPEPDPIPEPEAGGLEPDVDLDSMTKAQLKEYAESIDVHVPSDMTKAEVRDLLEG